LKIPHIDAGRGRETEVSRGGKASGASELKPRGFKEERSDDGDMRYDAEVASLFQ